MPEIVGGRGARFLLLAACLVVVVYGLRAAAAILVPFALALFLTVLSLPLLSWLQRRRVPSWLAVLLTVLANVAALGAVGLMVSQTLNEFVAALPRYTAGLQRMAAASIARIEAHGIGVSRWISTDLIDPGRVMDMAGGALRGIAAFLSSAFLVVIFMSFMLAEAAAFPGKLRSALGGRHLGRYATVTREVQHYLGIKTLVSLATGLLVGLWVWAMGVDFPILWGLVAFLLNYIPTIGSILAALPAVLLALVQFGASRGALVVLGYLAVNVGLGNLLEPNVMGRRLGLSPLVVILSLLFWGWLWGPVGMLLAVPLTMVLRITLEHTEDLHWVAVLLGPGERRGRASADAPAPAPEAARSRETGPDVAD